MKIHRGLEQRSWEWFKLRSGKVTASEIGELMTDKGAIRSWKSATPNTYLHLKLAEAWRGGPLEVFNGSRQTDQGVFNEPKARETYSFLFDRPVEQIGGIASDDDRCWCSPDGWLRVGVPAEAEGDVGLEIKCPNPNTHIGYLLGGGVPEEYVLQVQFSMFVSGCACWHFLSYCRDLPELFVPVRRDAEIIEIIQEAVTEFLGHFDAAWNHLCELNGGPPVKRELKAPRGFGAQHIESDEQHAQHVFTDPDDYKM